MAEDTGLEPVRANPLVFKTSALPIRLIFRILDTDITNVINYSTTIVIVILYFVYTKYNTVYLYRMHIELAPNYIDIRENFYIFSTLSTSRINK